MPKLLEAAPKSQLAREALGAVPLKEWYSVDELEPMTSISKWTWRRWAHLGIISSAKVSTRLLISRSEYERIMREGTRPARVAKRKPRGRPRKDGQPVAPAAEEIG
jgi:hypothetical protein